MFRYIDALCLLPLHVYPKTHTDTRLMRREPIKGMHLHPDLVITWRSTETLMLVRAPKVHESKKFHPDRVKIHLKLLCWLTTWRRR